MLNDSGHHGALNLLAVLFKRRARIVAFSLVGLACGAGYIAIEGRRYSSSARVLVMAPAGQEGVYADRGQAARDEAEILRDPALMQAILPTASARRQATPDAYARAGAWARRVVGMGVADDTNAGRLARLQRALSVQALAGTDVVALTLVWPDAQAGADVLNGLLAEVQRAAAASAVAKEGLGTAETRLREAQGRLAAAQAPLAAQMPAGQVGALRVERDRVGSRLAAARSDGDAMRLERELASRKLDGVEQAYRAGGWVDSPDAKETASGAPELDQVFASLLEKKQTLGSLPPDNPKVRDIDRRIAQVREDNYKNVKQVYTSQVAALESRLARQAADTAADEARQRDLDDKLVAALAVEQTRDAAAAEVQSAQLALADLRGRIDPGLRDVGTMRVLSAALPASMPDGPPRLVVLGGSVLVGLVLGLASAALAERMRRTLDGPDEVSRFLDVQVLARIPDLR